MAFLTTMNIIGSGMTAQQLRLDVISENITNATTTRTENGGPYRRKVVVMQAESNKNGFRMAMMRAARRGLTAAGRRVGPAGGVRITEIAEDQTEFPIVYDPAHPDANEAGYVEMPNITMVKEVTDAMAAQQAYNADVTAFNILRTVVNAGLQISGR